jgi:large subunit ribosomal protein L18
MKHQGYTMSSKALRKQRVRIKTVGTGKPRLTVFRSNKYVYAQIIDDKKGVTLVEVSSAKDAPKDKMNRTQAAKHIGEILATEAVKKKIKEVVFDRGSYKYHGIIKALADSAREKGLVF